MTARTGAQLRVLLVTKGLDFGGIERVVVALSTGLTERGHRVDVAMVNGRRAGMVGELDAAGVTVHRLPGGDRIGWRGAIELTKLVRDERFDVIHVHGPLPAVLARLTPGAGPIVTTSHTPVEMLHPITRRLWTSTRRRDAVSMAVGSAVAASIPTAVVMPHAPTVTHAAPRSGPTSNEVARPTEVIIVASHRRVKNHPNLFDAVARVRRLGIDLRVVAVGEGPELERNKASAASHGLREVVEFRRPHAGVLGDIAAADVLVVSSDYEGQPLVVAEALACGTPVVATDVGRVRELVDDDVGRIVPVSDPVALASALAELAGSPGLRRAMSDAAVERASRWTLSDVIDAHEVVYRRASAR